MGSWYFFERTGGENLVLKYQPIMVAQVDYHIRAEQSINGKETTEYIHKVSMI